VEVEEPDRQTLTILICLTTSPCTNTVKTASGTSPIKNCVHESLRSLTFIARTPSAAFLL